MKDISELLPVGSVVTLKGDKKSLMIIGIMQKKISTDEIYDYVGVFYPEGYIGGKFQFLFMHENIDEVLWEGFRNDAYEKMMKRIRKLKNEKNQ